MASGERRIGYDLLRIAAVAFVVAHHSVLVFRGQGDVTLLRSLGFLGVEIFFVLSGFLVFRGLIPRLVANPRPAGVLRFYVGRWLRVYPSYAAALMLVFLLTRVAPPPSAWLLVLPPGTATADYLGPAWTLSVQEWFYALIAPLLLVVLRGARGHVSARSAFFATLFAVGALAFLARYYVVLRYDPAFATIVRATPPLRFDALTAGALLAGVSHYWPAAFSRIGRSPFALAAASVAAVAVIWYDAMHPPAAPSQIWAITVFSFVPVSFALGVAWFGSNRRINAGVWRPFASALRFLVGISFPVYLVHVPIFVYVAGLPGLSHRQGLVVAWALSVGVAWLLHRGVEQPALALRARWLAPRASFALLAQSSSPPVRGDG